MDTNAAFQSTFKVIFGECSLNMKDLENYLLKYQPKMGRQKSFLSGSPVSISGASYPPNARFISQSEINFGKKATPLNVNSIKDFDSLVSAAKEEAIFAGNKVFGNSQNISNSDGITNSHYVEDSHVIHSSKFVGCSSFIHDGSEYVFGSSWLGRGRFLIRTINALDLSRSFECYSSGLGSDMFCTFNCLDCNDVMFSFNLKGRRNCIGNLELPRDEYLKLKAKIISEAREYIEKHRDFPTIFEFPDSETLPASLPKVEKKARKPSDPKPIESAWASTSALLLGKSAPSLQASRAYLSEAIHKTSTLKTLFGSDVFIGDVFFFPAIPKRRLLAEDEATLLASLKLGREEAASLDAIRKNLSKIAFYRANFTGGNASNNEKTAIAYESANAYEVLDSTISKNNAFCTMALESSYCFGSYRVVHCDFSVRCHNCDGLSRCIEMDCCSGCRDSLYCHNCENLESCMFCFNAKNLRFAIGNVEVGKEAFMKAKALLCSEILASIQNGRKLPSIYEIAGKAASG